MKLNFGAGHWQQKGWINLDYHTGYDLNKSLLRQFPDQSVEAIFTSHCLEHLPFETILPLFKECYRVMQPGALMHITLPDIDIFSRILQENDTEFLPRANPSYYAVPPRNQRPLETNVQEAAGFIFGWTQMECDHRCFFNYNTLYLLLRFAGFTKINQVPAQQSRLVECNANTRDAGGGYLGGFINGDSVAFSLFADVER